MAQTFRCTLLTPQQQLLDEEAVYASIPAYDGQMGIAPQRATMLTRLGEGPLRLDLARGQTRWFFISGGFAQMKANRLTILTRQALPSDEIDSQYIQQTRQQAQSIRGTDDQSVQQRWQLENRSRLLEQVLRQARTHQPTG